MLPGLTYVFDVLLFVMFSATLVVFVADGWQLNRRRRSSGSRAPTRTMLVTGSLMPLTALALAGLLTAASLAGLALLVGDWLGGLVSVGAGQSTTTETVRILFPQPYQALARFLVISPLLLVLFAVIGLLFTHRSRRGRVTEASKELHATWARLDPADPADPALGNASRPDPAPPDRAWLKRQRQTLWLPDIVLTGGMWGLGGLASLVTVLTVGYSGYWLSGLLSGTNTRYADVALPWLPLIPLRFSMAVLTLIPVAMVYLLRLGLAQPSRRRVIAILWDVLTFWPRSFHPLAPPSYAERAVPELRTRLRRIWQQGGGCVLLGHSQGSVLAAATVAGLAEPGNGEPSTTAETPLADKLSLITYGSPLTRLYARFFPAFFDAEFFAQVCRRLPPGDSSSWTNFYRDTDPVGQRVDAGPDAEPNVYLADPAQPYYYEGDELPIIRGHAEAQYRRQADFHDVVLAQVRRLAAAGERRPGRPDPPAEPRT
jgi:hypothetical protein